MAIASLYRSLPLRMLTCVALILIGAGVFWTLGLGRAYRHSARATTHPSPQAESRSTVVCLGRIEPKDGVLYLAARSLAGQPSIVRELRKQAGTQVQKDEVLAILDSFPQLEASWRQAESEVGVSRAALERIRAGAKAEDLAAKRAEIARLEAALRNAQSEFTRYDTLHRKSSVTDSEMDAKRLSVEASRLSLEEAQEQLASLAVVRQVDLNLAQAQLEAAMRNAERAHTEMQEAIVRAPCGGQIVRINAHPGEVVGSRGIVELAPAGPWYVVAEVYESDLARLKAGQQCSMTGEAFEGALHGVIERIGSEILQNTIPNPDLTMYSDRRVEKVWIRLDNSFSHWGLISAQVTVRIEVGGSVELKTAAGRN
ncbi:MAG TPA: HlyD family efflux transporter periplasmic adaptor subunit [Acidobacteriota bacterium]|nr:HlyD family efflux transporter periplasmic adaptor subunit [Acidobacteriota bacterium]